MLKVYFHYSKCGFHAIVKGFHACQFKLVLFQFFEFSFLKFQRLFSSQKLIDHMHFALYCHRLQEILLFLSPLPKTASYAILNLSQHLYLKQFHLQLGSTCASFVSRDQKVICLAPNHYFSFLTYGPVSSLTNLEDSNKCF